jgi:16S rRNA (adenine1518-N6/adenine1519-N6)-dimethyltransferase
LSEKNAVNDDFSHRARKRFGQNFLHDTNIIRRIVQAVVADADTRLIEIGPGKGAITEPLLSAHTALTVIEVDRDLAAHLTNRFGDNPGFRLINQDVLKVPIDQLLSGAKQLCVVGNLPYNISTPLIFQLLQHHALIRDMIFMLQLEVVERMCASPGDEGYGRLSIMVQYYCLVENLFLVPPSAFTPVPKVQSAVVRLVPHTTLPYEARDTVLFARVVREAFNQRRKTLRNSLKALIEPAMLEHIGIDSSLRPEALSLKDYVSISNALTLN